MERFCFCSCVRYQWRCVHELDDYRSGEQWHAYQIDTTLTHTTWNQRLNLNISVLLKIVKTFLTRWNRGYSFCDRSYKRGYYSKMGSGLREELYINLKASESFSALIEEDNCNRKGSTDQGDGCIFARNIPFTCLLNCVGAGNCKSPYMLSPASLQNIGN